MNSHTSSEPLTLKILGLSLLSTLVGNLQPYMEISTESSSLLLSKSQIVNPVEKSLSWLHQLLTTSLISTSLLFVVSK
jgi:hypothetical protein